MVQLQAWHPEKGFSVQGGAIKWPCRCGYPVCCNGQSTVLRREPALPVQLAQVLPYRICNSTVSLILNQPLESSNMKKSLLAIAIATVFTANFAYADDVAAPEVKPDNEVSFNLGVASDYRYRGISQSNMDPALQGGADYTNNPTGLYAGTWLSTIKWTKDDGGSGNVEWDLYAGKRGDIATDLTYDVGVLQYVYPSNGLGSITGFADANTTELYGQLAYKVLSVKYSQSVTNLFAVPNSKGSGYVDVSANFDLTEGYTLGLHGGHQTVKNTDALSYSDWKIGVSKDFIGVTFSLGVIGTNASKSLYVTPEGKFTGKTSAFLTGTKTF